MAILKTESTYPFKHWITAIAIGPLIQIPFLHADASLTGFAGMYFLFIIYGIGFSLPTFILYLLAFNQLVRKTQSAILIKIVLNIITITAVFITIKIIGGTLMTGTLALYYSIGVIIGSLLYKIDFKTADA